MNGGFDFDVRLCEAALMPEGVREEILQNVKNILATPKGSVPSARGIGVDMSFIDRPPQIARTLAVAAIHDALANEQRAQVAGISFETDALNGRSRALVTIKIT